MLPVPDEGGIRASWNAKDYDRATATGLELYGSEIFGLLVALHKDVDEADDAFSLFAERLWRTLSSFQWKCSLRTWVYRLARNASADVAREVQRQQRHRGPYSANPTVQQAVQAVRTATISMLQTANRNQLERLRYELDEADRLLLILRVDRELPWLDIARVVSDLPEDGGEAEVTREVARLRKRFQLVKEHLRKLAKERGLIA